MRSSRMTRSNLSFIKENRHEFRVSKMCRGLGISKSGFYRWINHALPPEKKRKARLKQQIEAIFNSPNIAMAVGKSLRCWILACLRADSDPLYEGDGSAFEDYKATMN